MTWSPQVGRMDAGSGSTFIAFDTEVLQPDGSHKTVHIGSLRDLRRVERETEQAQRNGEGQQLVWREWSQDKSNADVHSFIPKDPGQIAREELAAMQAEAKSRGSVSRLRVTEASVPELGPGVTDESASPLSHLDG